MNVNYLVDLEDCEENRAIRIIDEIKHSFPDDLSKAIDYYELTLKGRESNKYEIVRNPIMMFANAILSEIESGGKNKIDSYSKDLFIDLIWNFREVFVVPRGGSLICFVSGIFSGKRSIYSFKDSLYCVYTKSRLNTPSAGFKIPDSNIHSEIQNMLELGETYFTSLGVKFCKERNLL